MAELLTHIDPETGGDILARNGFESLAELSLASEKGLDDLITELAAEAKKQKADRAASATK